MKPPVQIAGVRVCPLLFTIKCIKSMEQKDAETYIIVSGKWTDNGNFSGYTGRGKRVHIYSHQMGAAGFTKDTIKYPFIALAEEKSYDARVDADGKPIGKPIENRLTATAVFAHEDALVEMLAMERGFNNRIERKVTARAKVLDTDDVVTASNKGTIIA